MDKKSLDTGNATLMGIAKKLILLTIPISFTFIFIFLSDSIDTIFSSRYNAVTLAAISIANIIGILPLATVNGIAYTAVPQYSYLMQKNKTNEIFNLLIEFFIITFTLGTALSLLFIIFIPHILNLIGVDPTLIPLVQTYLKFILPYILGMLAFNNFYYFSESCGIPILATITVIISFCIKGLFIYIFVFSDLTQQSWGIYGFGMATVVFAWSKFLILLPMVLSYKKFRIIWHTPLKRLNLSMTRMCKNTIKGIPIALSYLSEWGAVSVMGLIIAKLGVNQIGANSIVYSVIPLSLVIVTALSRSIAILVAQYQDQKNILKQTLTVGMAISVTLLCIICIILFCFSKLIIGIYKPDTSLLSTINGIYPYMIWVVFCLGLNNVFCFALKGLSDFFAVFLILFITSWLLFIPLGYVLSSTHYFFPEQGIQGWWYALSISTCVSACLSLWRLSVLITKKPEQISV